MTTNLLIASLYVLISIGVILNFTRLFQLGSRLISRLLKLRLLIGTLIRAYNRYKKIQMRNLNNFSFNT